jgi:hydrogenase expression/formation protein HypC
MELIKIDGAKGIARAEGLEREVDLQFLKSPRRGDFIMIHAGFAIEKLDREKARQTLRLFKEMKE